MKRFYIGLLLVIFASTVIGKQPEFEDYSVKEIYTGKNHEAVIEKHNLSIKSILIESSKLPVNFAGHYIFYTYPCGGGCIAGGVIDALTGKAVSELPCSYETVDGGDRKFSISFSKNSRLLIVNGKRVDYDGSESEVFGRDFFELKHDKFQILNQNSKHSPHHE